jgi:hypothetical protein
LTTNNDLFGCLFGGIEVVEVVEAVEVVEVVDSKERGLLLLVRLLLVMVVVVLRDSEEVAEGGSAEGNINGEMWYFLVARLMALPL